MKTCGVPVIDTSEMGNRSVKLGDKVTFNCKVSWAAAVAIEQDPLHSIQFKISTLHFELKSIHTISSWDLLSVWFSHLSKVCHASIFATASSQWSNIILTTKYILDEKKPQNFVSSSSPYLVILQQYVSPQSSYFEYTIQSLKFSMQSYS